jgi:hypothetical protein
MGMLKECKPLGNRCLQTRMAVKEIKSRNKLLKSLGRLTQKWKN